MLSDDTQSPTRNRRVEGPGTRMPNPNPTSQWGWRVMGNPGAASASLLPLYRVRKIST